MTTPARPRANATIGEIAAAVGVSPATVSRAFTRPEKLRPETVELVRRTAEKLSYVPNHAARVLSTGKQGNIAVIVPDIANPFFPPLIRAAQARADAAGHCAFIGDSAETAAREDQLLTRLRTQVAGFVLVSSRLPDDRIVEAAARHPLVLVNRNTNGVPRVLIDTACGMREAVGHLADLGHRDLAYVSGPAESWSNRQRRRAIRAAARDAGCTLSILPPVEAAFAAGERMVPALLNTGATAAIAFDDLIAQGLLAGLAARGIKVPGQFSLIGCDDVLAPMTYPPLTTISSHPGDAGDLAVDLLLRQFEAGTRDPVKRILPSHLLVRGTTAAKP